MTFGRTKKNRGSWSGVVELNLKWPLKKSLMTCLDNKWLKITEMLQTFYTDLLDSKAVVKSSQDFFPSRQIYCQILCILCQKVSLNKYEIKNILKSSKNKDQ